MSLPKYFSQVGLLPVGDHSQVVIDWASRFLATETGKEVVVLPCQEYHKWQWGYGEKKLPYNFQIDGEWLLDWLWTEQLQRFDRVVALVSHDAKSAGRTFVFGYGHMRKDVCFVATPRLQEGWYGRSDNPERFKERLEKALRHELAHTYGLMHCVSEACVLHSVRFVEDLDALPFNLCGSCEKMRQRAKNVSVLLRHAVRAGLWEADGDEVKMMQHVRAGMRITERRERREEAQ